MRERRNNGAIWEDVYYGHLMMRELSMSQVTLVQAPFMDEGFEQRLADCRLRRQYEEGRLSALTYHGLKKPEQFEPFLREGNRWLLHHDAAERIRCDDLMRRSSADNAAGQLWQRCEFVHAENNSPSARAEKAV